jgi:hypothetical protein
MSFDLEELVNDMHGAASAVLNTDVAALRGFSARQLQAIAHQADLVATGIAEGSITKETREFFLDSLEDMAYSFAKTLRGLLLVTIEKVWNAIVGVLWTAISKVTGLALSVPAVHD